MEYKKYMISQGGVEIGLSWNDIEEYLLTPAQFKEFGEFMKGQTCGMVGGIPICYTEDFDRFLKELPMEYFLKIQRDQLHLMLEDKRLWGNTECKECLMTQKELDKIRTWLKK